MSTVAERVVQGTAWLDANRAGWIGHIDLDTLDLGNPCCCTLGQEFGDYIAGLDAIGDTTGEWPDAGAAARGFVALVDDDEYAALTAEWRALIQARRQDGAS